MSNIYTEPVSKLLTIGELEFGSEWLNYGENGITREDIPELIRMINDEELLLSDDEVELWAPVHAWRALGQMRTDDTIEPLLAVLEIDDDWACEDIINIYINIGPAAIPALTAYIADTANGDFGVLRAIEAVEKIGTANPEHIPGLIEVFKTRLGKCIFQDDEINGSLIDALCQFKAIDTLPLIKEAYQAQCVDELMAGSWEYAQAAMGIPEQEITHIPMTEEQKMFREMVNKFPMGYNSPQPSNKKVADKKKKEVNKKKMAKLSKKKNRKK